MPLLAYKVFPDGHEELVRGAALPRLERRARSRTFWRPATIARVFEFMDNAAPFALIGGGGFTAEACVMAPSILIDDLELHPDRGGAAEAAGGSAAGH